MKIGIDEWCYHNSMLTGRMDIEDLINRCGELGVSGVGFDYFMLAKKHRKEPEIIKGLLESNGLELVFGFSFPFALPDAAFRLVEDRRDEMFDLAHEFNAKILRVVGGVILPNPVHKPFHLSASVDDEVGRVARRLRDFCEDAKLEGLTVALENHTEYTADQMLRIVDEVAMDNFKITLDTGNCMYIGEDPIETVEKLAPHAAHTHIKDMKQTGPFMMSVPLGRGDVGIATAVEVLRGSGYSGLYNIEVDLPVWEAGKEDRYLQESIEFLLGLGG